VKAWFNREKRQQGTGTHLGFELRLNRSEEAFDQAAGRRNRPRPGARAECSMRSRRGAARGRDRSWRCPGRVPDWPRGPTNAEQGVDEDVEVLSQIVTAFDGIAAVAVEEAGKMGFHHAVFVQHKGPVLEVSQPEGIAEVTRPTAAPPSVG